MYPAKVVRLWPRGSRKYRHFIIVLCYQRSRNRGKVIERLGHLNPQKRERTLHINGQRLAFWLNRGARLHRSVLYAIGHRAIHDSD